jgi:hypothetical protein
MTGFCGNAIVLMATVIFSMPSWPADLPLRTVVPGSRVGFPSAVYLVDDEMEFVLSADAIEEFLDDGLVIAVVVLEYRPGATRRLANATMARHQRVRFTGCAERSRAVLTGDVAYGHFLVDDEDVGDWYVRGVAPSPRPKENIVEWGCLWFRLHREGQFPSGLGGQSVEVDINAQMRRWSRAHPKVGGAGNHVASSPR